jgi:phage replication-related protein YjqB (UPF0714/DUF867 family)
MADTYPDFETLSRSETAGVDYRILLRRSRAPFALVAPHGGGIEPGSSEIADAIAGDAHSFYAFEGVKPAGNTDLHITSTRFDEPLCLTLIGRTNIVVTLHGESSDAGPVTFLGGQDAALGGLIGASLERAGFEVRRHTDPDLQGLDCWNICNRGLSRKGVQLELSLALRRTLFTSLTREGRRCPTERFHEFVAAVASVLQTT